MKQKTFFNLSNDHLFKLIFSNEQHLKFLLENCFQLKLDTFHYTKESLVKKNKNLSYGVNDLCIETDDAIIIIEMQNRKSKSLPKRMMQYAASKFNENYQRVKRKNKENDYFYDLYAHMKPIISCWILNYQLENEDLLTFKMLEKKMHTELGDNIEVRLFGIKNEHHTKITQSISRLFNALCLEELNDLKTDTNFKTMIDDMKMYNMDEEQYKEMEAKKRMDEKYEDQLIFDTLESYKEGKEEGKLEGKLEGISIGKKEGKREGKIESKLEIARNLLAAGMDIAFISKMTGLEAQQFQNHQANIL